ncbi:SAM-dependent methyltransferase [Nonomuraea thailandensis]|uniref:SAM-dependent methyltransferase n=1 Tax=Nonomuraea thailandensis TaxID=1188745 RepID=A0A9X2K365_9ACTN|nr:class I SAM-dependent methyltransferase [Nonomuraea thailandensis]MCP2358059.1 SAM-dependent methyltransferase [Nonomuraea thailandensis]
MTDIVNTEQAAAWNGPEGAHWAEHNPADGGFNAELTAPLLTAANIRPDDHVLDIGCGTGETTRLAARQARDGHAVGIDLSAAMLQQARAAAEAAGLGNVAFEEGDAQAYPFAAGRYQVAISRFGIMFFADPVAAFANIGRALRPGGRLVFVCPRSMADNDWYVVPLSALHKRLGTATLPESGMFSLADPAHTTDVLTRAGFSEVTLRPLDAPMDFGADAHAAADGYLGSGPVLAVLEQPGGLTRATARDLLADALRPYESPDGVRIPGGHWLVVARRPTENLSARGAHRPRPGR